MHIDSVSIKHFKGLQNVELRDCSGVNVLVGKNNSGKSSVLHAIDMAILALKVGSWNRFQPKLEIKDLFNDVGNFEIKLNLHDGTLAQIKSGKHFGPELSPPGKNESISR